LEEADMQADESGRISFQVSRNAVVYLFMPHNRAATSDWSLVEEGVHINGTWYSGGTSVYMKRFSAGALVDLPGTPAGVLPPLAIAQETGTISAEIKIRSGSTVTGSEPESGLSAFQTDDYEAGTEIVLEAVMSPWQYSRRLPLLNRWLIHTADGWVPVEGNRYEIPADGPNAYLRFRLEVSTPDGQVEYRTEKTIGIIVKHSEEE
jgi:hypothetical protein